MKSSILCFLIKKISWVLGHLPLETCLFIGRRLGEVSYFVHRRKWIAYANLRSVFSKERTPKELKRIVLDSYRHLGMTGVEFLRFPYFEADYTVRYFDKPDKGIEKMLHVLAARKNGVILLTAHLDNWELAGYFSAKAGFPLNVLVTNQKDSALNQLLNQYREVTGNKVIGKGMPIRELITALRENQLVAIVADQAGDESDVYLDFFGRKTASHSGPFRIAQKCGSALFPFFMIRKQTVRHEGILLPEIRFRDDLKREESLKEAMQEYLGRLEEQIRQHPEQWLWGHKRWKHCLTRRVAILTDGKPGHMNQSHTIFEWICQAAKQSGAAKLQNMEFVLQVVPVRFKSSSLQKLFMAISWLFVGASRGRMSWIHWFLEKKSAEIVLRTHADLIVSCGASLIPISIMLKRENAGKNILIMKPPKPYRLSAFDLVITPMHDGAPRRANVVDTLIAPNQIHPTFLEEQAQNVKKMLRRPPQKDTLCLLVGGDTKQYRFHYSVFEEWVKRLRSFLQAYHFRILVSNSRRSRPDITQILKYEFEKEDACDLFINVFHKNPTNAIYGMMALANTIIVTEESVSMISEAVQTGKKVFVLRPSSDLLAPKHRRFHRALQERGLIEYLDINKMATQLKSRSANSHSLEILSRDQEKVKKQLQRLL